MSDDYGDFEAEFIEVRGKLANLDYDLGAATRSIVRHDETLLTHTKTLEDICLRVKRLSDQLARIWDMYSEILGTIQGKAAGGGEG